MKNKAEVFRLAFFFMTASMVEVSREPEVSVTHESSGKYAWNDPIYLSKCFVNTKILYFVNTKILCSYTNNKSKVNSLNMCYRNKVASD